MGMVNRLLCTAFLAVFAASAQAVSFSEQDYEVYEGDLNNDGLKDLYFRGKPRFILLHGKPAIPLAPPPQTSYVLYREVLQEECSDSSPGGCPPGHDEHDDDIPAEYGYGDASAYERLSDDDLAMHGLQRLIPGQRYIVADINRDGITDILLKTNFKKAYFYLGSTGNQAPVEHRTFKDELAAIINDGNIALRDANRNGHVDIVSISSDSQLADLMITGSSGYQSTAYVLEPEPPRPATLVGATVGQFRVSEVGAATYSVPLALPTGVAGMSPSASLNYSSQSGNGILGYGWSLGASSTIARCRPTTYIDGEAKPLQLNEEDAFCLNGQRLRYGGDNRYRTHIDSHEYIYAEGDYGNPTSWKIIAKDGSLKEFKQVNNAAVRLGDKVLSWSLSSVKDNIGNTIHYHYAGGATDHRLIRISYAGSAEVTFNYSSRRPDAQSGYVAGYPTKTTRRLQSVDVKDNNRTLRKYYLTYQKATQDNRISRLHRIQECAFGGGREQCLAPLSFNWQSQEIGRGFHEAIEPPFSNYDDRRFLTYRAADINGDGCQDMVVGWHNTQRNSYDTTYSLSEPGCTSYSVSFSLTSHTIDENHSEYELAILDYNSDGRSDVAIRYGEDDIWNLYRAKPNATNGEWSISTTGTPLISQAKGKFFIDINGDGLVDNVDYNKAHLLERHITGTSSTQTPNRYSASVIKEWAASPGFEREIKGFGDFNGDGNMDHVEFRDSFSGGYYGDCGSVPDYDCEPDEPNEWIQAFRIRTHNGDSVSNFADLRTVQRDCLDLPSEDCTTQSDPKLDGTPLVVDINSDGLSDLLIQRGDVFLLYLSTGEGLSSPISVPASPADLQLASVDQTFLPSVVDYNRDGYADLFWHDRSDQRLKVAFWNAATNSFNDEVMDIGYGRADSAYSFMDVNGDGGQDLVYIQAAHSANADKKLYVRFNRDNKIHNHITSIDNNFGNSTEISYERMHESGHYTRLDTKAKLLKSTHPCSSNPDSLEPEIDQVCTVHTANTDELYSALSNPFDLPEGDPELKWPVFDLNSPIAIVTRVESSAPIKNDLNNKSAVEYFYTEAKMQAGGRGFLGFKTLSTMDMQTEITTTTEYHQDFPYQGMPRRTTVVSPQGDVLSEAINTYKDKSTQPHYRQPYLDKSEEISYAHSSLPDQHGIVRPGIIVDNDTIVKRVITENSYDHFGNILDTEVTTSGDYADADLPGGTGSVEHSKKVYNSYGGLAQVTVHGKTLYHSELGRLSSTATSITRDGEPLPGRTANFTYYDDEYGVLAGMLESEELHKGQARQHNLKTSYTYDAFGNIDTTTQVGWDGQNNDAERTANNDYDTQGRYLSERYNALEHRVEKVNSRNDYGAPTEIEDVNGVITTITYDALGRETSRYDSTASENTVTTEYLRCASVSPACPSGTQYAVRKTVDHGVATIEYLDALGRTIRTARENFHGNWVYVDSEYDALGRVVRVSEPYDSIVQYWTETEYDVLGRVRKISAPSSATASGMANTIIRYEGASTITTNPAGHTKRETHNSLGELVKVEDNYHDSSRDYAYIRYLYDGNSNLTHTRVYPDDSNEFIETVIRYDVLSRKTFMNDPDKGFWTYEYNAFGELIRQTNANHQMVLNQYDALGRLTQRTDYKSRDKKNSNIAQRTNWFYDGNTDTGGFVENATGQLSAVVVGSSSTNYCYYGSYCAYTTFDTHGRPTQVETVLDTDNNPDTAKETFITKTEYNSVTGRVLNSYDAMDQKLRDGNTQLRSGTRQYYNARGFLTHTQDIGTGETLYQTVDTNVRGQVTQAYVGAYGRTLYYDDITGELETQIAYVGGLGDLDPTADAFTIQHISYDWDVLGNLKSRHNQSSLRNNGASSGLRNLQESFCYDSLNRLIKTHIDTTNGSCSNLTSAQQDVRYDTVGNITYKKDVGTYSYNGTGPHAVSATSDNVSYYYDNNGNLTSDSSGRTLTYSTFDKAVSITKGSHTSTFSYGPDRQRFLQIDSNSAVSSKNMTTVYLGNVELRKHNDGSYEWRRSVAGGLRTYTTDSNGQLTGDEEQRYIFKDHLGSVDVIADAWGNIEQSMSFDPWGARREETASLPVLSATELFNFSDDITSRGYTGHEMLDEVGLIHMNGRLYDARLARFIQADPFVQAAKDVQMFNRYSYLRNNPLNATDPSGYFLKKLWNKVRPFVGTLVSIGFAIWQPWAASFANSVLIGMISGAAGAAANGGNILRGAVMGGLSAAAFHKVGDMFLKDNCSTCHVAENAKGTFGTTLTKSAFAKKVLAHAVTGGVMSTLQGGKFGHGFAAAGVTQAFSGKIDTLDSGTKGASATRAFAAAVVGGTASKLSGGKFANGAITGAFSRLFNDDAHNETQKELDRRNRALQEIRDRVYGMNPKALYEEAKLAGFSGITSPELLKTRMLLSIDQALVEGATSHLKPIASGANPSAGGIVTEGGEAWFSHSVSVIASDIGSKLKYTFSSVGSLIGGASDLSSLSSFGNNFDNSFGYVEIWDCNSRNCIVEPFVYDK